jgi:hypothetical protein
MLVQRKRYNISDLKNVTDGLTNQLKEKTKFLVKGDSWFEIYSFDYFGSIEIEVLSDKNKRWKRMRDIYSAVNYAMKNNILKFKNATIEEEAFSCRIMFYTLGK